MATRVDCPFTARSSPERCAPISKFRRPNFHITEQRIPLGEPSGSIKEMIRQMLEKKQYNAPCRRTHPPAFSAAEKPHSTIRWTAELTRRAHRQVDWRPYFVRT